MSDKIGSLVIDVSGHHLSPEDKEILQHPMIGGMILFAHNYDSRQQMSALCQAMRAARKKPMLIMVDQEGGRVQRFISEFTRLPFMSVFGEYFDQDEALACDMAKDCGWLMATELLSIGIDISLAPVLDLNKGISSIIGKRAFHANPATVTKLASAFIHGMHEAGMASTGKHFPGHGSIQLDSHLARPVDERTLEELRDDDLLPFTGLINAGIKAIMASHIIFPAADSLPVSYSRQWLTNILREKMKFNGVILSDDLNMEGANISPHFADRVKTAKEAGCDFVLLCNNREAVISVLDNLNPDDLLIEQGKMDVMCARHNGELAYQQNPRWLKTHNLLHKLDSGKK